MDWGRLRRKQNFDGRGGRCFLCNMKASKEGVDGGQPVKLGSNEPPSW